jgi:hypothetical protein
LILKRLVHASPTSQPEAITAQHMNDFKVLVSLTESKEDIACVVTDNVCVESKRLLESAKSLNKYKC